MNRAQRRRHGHHHEHDWFGVQVGWCATAEDLPECRRQTHDSLIVLMGGGRTGGVEWRQTTGQAALDLIASLLASEDTPSPLIPYYRQIETYLREDGGWLVMATAPGIPVRGRG